MEDWNVSPTETLSGGTDVPLVSVVIPTYDRPTYLRRAVESVVEQTYDEIELVVVDDNPTTPAREAVRDVPLDSLTNVEFVRDRDHENAAAARNTGVEVAAGEYVAFLDDDDRWYPEKLATQIATFQRTSDDVGLVYSGAELLYDRGDRTISIPPAVEGDMTKVLLRRNVVGSMSVVVVQRNVAAATPFDERFPSWEDLVWYIDLSRRCSFERIPEPLVEYEHSSPGRLSEDLERERRSRDLFLEKYRSLAREYGPLFARQVRAWTTFRAGTVAFHGGEYSTARRRFLRAVALYPFETRFYPYLMTALGGRPLHRTVRAVRAVLRRLG